MTSELRRSRRDRAWPGIATPGADAISRRLREGEPFPDGVGRVSSRVIAEPAGQDDAGSPGKHERDLAHRFSPLLVTLLTLRASMACLLVSGQAAVPRGRSTPRSEEHTSELQSPCN